MTIKSDRWIQQMAESQDMISPFAANQIRERDGEKLISYGTSSYGYDVRCADEFFDDPFSSIIHRQSLDFHRSKENTTLFYYPLLPSQLGEGEEVMRRIKSE